MTRAPALLRVVGSGRVEPHEAVQALASGFTVEAESNRPWVRVRRVWLDTFDWRLHDAGFCLAAAEWQDAHVLVLDAADGSRTTQPLAPVTWPALASDLPPGPVRDRVADAVGVRALLPLTEEAVDRAGLRLLDANAKSVVRVEVERPCREPDGQDGPLIVRLAPLRGYEAEARRARRLLVASGEAAVTSWSTPRDRALSGSSRRPGDYSSRLDVPLDADMPAGVAVGCVLTDLRDHVEANLPGTLDTLDTEFLHDLRVAVRRARGVVKLTRAVLPEEPASGLAAELKWLGDVTTPGRDLDVYLLGLGEMAAWLVSASPRDLDPLEAHLRRLRGREQRRLTRALRSQRLSRLLDAWKDVVAAAETSDGLTAGELGSRCLARADRRVVRLGGSITAGSPASHLHDLRKRAKELRYTLEAFGSLLDRAESGTVVSRLKGLQDCLGRFQDAEVQRAGIGTFAAEMIEAGSAPAATILAMGELAAHLDADQAGARSAFDARFARFGAAATRRRVAALVAGGAARRSGHGGRT